MVGGGGEGAEISTQCGRSAATFGWPRSDVQRIALGTDSVDIFAVRGGELRRQRPHHLLSPQPNQ